MIRRLFQILLFFIGFVTGGRLFADDLPVIIASPESCRHYLLLFGGQADKNRPQTAHTWATFVKAVPQKTGTVLLDAFTISWLPIQMPVRPLQLIPEAGRNYGLQETLSFFNTGKQKVSFWGPFQIREAWYNEALQHKQYLDSGAVRFNTLDRGPLVPRTLTLHPEISHCVHAFTRTNVSLQRASNPVIWYGEFITRNLARRMREVGLLIQPHVTHDWLIAPMGVDQYPLERRSIDEPLIKFLR